jgi:hypothetical protein
MQIPGLKFVLAIEATKQFTLVLDDVQLILLFCILYLIIMPIFGSDLECQSTLKE